MKNETDERICKNCKYHVEYYFCIDTRFLPLNDGHCKNSHFYNQRNKSPFKPRENCEFWESNESLKAKRIKTIEKVIRDIEKHLLHIKNILNIDNDKK